MPLRIFVKLGATKLNCKNRQVDPNFFFINMNIFIKPFSVVSDNK